jgi:phosphate transport system permease protein
VTTTEFKSPEFKTTALPPVSFRRKATDRFVHIVVYLFFGLALIPLASVIWLVVSKGLKRFDAAFFGKSLNGVAGFQEGGGAYHAVIGTLEQIALTTLFAVPIAIMTAVYLIEYGQGKKLARAISFFIDVMTGIPSIVAGLFILSFWILALGFDYSGLAGSFALTILMIPTVVRSAEEMLKLVPNDLREASYALGVPKWRTIVKIVLPTSLGGIITGVTLSVARVIGETAPLLIIAGSTDSVNTNIFGERMMTLPVFIYYSYTQPGVPAEFGQARAWGAALVLIVIVMALNLLARGLGRLFSPKTAR